MRRNMMVGALVAMVLAVAGVVRVLSQDITLPSPSAPQMAQEASAPSAGEIYLTYQEQTIPDRDLARVVGLIVNSVPSGRWATESLGEKEGLDGLIDRLFDYYATGNYAKPLTTAAIRKAVIDANPGVEKAGVGFPVRIPPVPVRGHGRWDYAPAIRAYEPQKQAYVTQQRAMAVSVATTPLVAEVAAMDPQRDASTTMVLLKVNEGLDAFIEREGKAALPRNVAFLSARSDESQPDKRLLMARVELLGQPQPVEPPCEDAAKWFDESPYKAEALQRVRALPGDTLLSRAKASPLSIIDTEFTPRGHGAKVRGVVEYVLNSLGVPQNVRTGGVLQFDLVGSSPEAKKAMHDVLDAYLKSDEAPTPNGLPQGEATKTWIDEESHFAALPGYNIPDLLIQAVFWKHLRASGWVNMSFRVDSPALRLIQRAFVEQRRSLAIVAAGNDPGELAPGWLPQESASVFPTVLNVSFGTRGGLIWGPRSGTINKTLVSVLAPGCGFDSVGFTDRGSSFASPYVAAAVWVKHLVDQVSPLTMRRALIAAAQPVPDEVTGIEGRGFFDPARLLIEPRPHLVLKDAAQTVEHVPSPVLTVTCADGDDEHRFSIRPKAQALQSVVVYKRGERHFLWHRTVPLDATQDIRFEPACSLEALEFRTGGTLRYGDAAAFETAVKELSM